MDGLMAPLLRTGIRAYLKDRFGDKFRGDEYERLAEEFTAETTSDEFLALRKLNGDERRALIRKIAGRIQARIKKSGSRKDKDMLKRIIRVRAETPASGPTRRAAKKKKKA